MTAILHPRRAWIQKSLALGGALALAPIVGCTPSTRKKNISEGLEDSNSSNKEGMPLGYVRIPTAEELVSSADARAAYTEIISKIFGNGLPENRVELGRLARGMKMSVSGIGHFAFTIPGNSVEHIKVATQYWATEFGVGPFFVLQSDAQVSQDYYPIDPKTGKRVGEDKKMANSEWPAFTALCKADKDYYVEINLQTNDTPSTYRDMYSSSQGGFHHFAVITPNFKADQVIMEARYQPSSALITSVGATYYDARKDVGCMFELLETNPFLNFLFKSTYELSQTARLSDYASSANIHRSDAKTDASNEGLTYPRISTKQKDSNSLRTALQNKV
jgi:hypothetical protein